MSEKGFTLIELLIVIAIIGIISTVAIINLNRSKEKAEEANLLQTMAIIQRAATICMYDNRDLLCNGAYCTGQQSSVPISGQILCAGSKNNWPDFDNPNMVLGIVSSNRAAGQFCFEVSWEDPNIALAGGGVYSIQYYCTNEECYQTPSLGSPCSISGCQQLGEACGPGNDCCGSYNCSSGICSMPEISS